MMMEEQGNEGRRLQSVGMGDWMTGTKKSHLQQNWRLSGTQVAFSGAVGGAFSQSQETLLRTGGTKGQPLQNG
jgi:hypothetical protein